MSWAKNFEPPSGQSLYMSCWPSPRAKVLAQARHEARAGPARARLASCCAGQKSHATGQPVGFRSNGLLYC
jgi:hypothetical protein